MTRTRVRVTLGGGLLWAVVVGATSVEAQPASRRPEVSGLVGYAGFVDEGGPIGHTVLGGFVRCPLTARLAVGPQVVYMVGPRSDRDLFVTGAVTWDLVSPAVDRPRVVPYLVADGGFMTHFERFGIRSFSHTEGAASGGLGVRVSGREGLVVAVEFRAGWELHYRLVGAIGYRVGS